MRLLEPPALSVGGVGLTAPVGVTRLAVSVYQTCSNMFLLRNIGMVFYFKSLIIPGKIA